VIVRALFTSLVLILSTQVAAAEPTAEASKVFAESVRAVLENRCLKCHSRAKKKGDLDLTSRETLLKGGKTGPSVVLGKSTESLLFRMIHHDEEPYMPQKEKKLPDEAIAQIGQWIDGGAPYDRPLVLPAAIKAEEGKSFWSFQALKRVDPPAVKDAAWPANAIDRFILSALEEKQVTPTASASKRTLIRRLYFDLLGLPPTPEQTEAFEQDNSPDAYARLVDALLADPRFGERQARHWLDVARYADSDGYEADSDRPNAYPYRDFVIRAFNQDLPFDTFVKWSLAGDEYAPDNPDALAATGFCAAGALVVYTKDKEGTPMEIEKARYDELDDILATTGSAMLGLTFGCARCHDHKYDPIPTRDYYRMLATFTTTRRGDTFLASRAEIDAYKRHDAEHQKKLGEAQRKLKEWLDPLKIALQPAIAAEKIASLTVSDADKALIALASDEKNKPQQELLKKHAKALQASDEDYRKRMPEDQRGAWDEKLAEIKAIEAAKPEAPPQGLALTDKAATPAKSFLLERGDPERKAGEIEAGFLGVLCSAEMPKPARPADASTTWQRRAMAEWLTDAQNGAGELLARVIVNRLWQHHFGEGLVRTPNDFGFQGERPTHPELLDWLASELIAGGWKLKPIHILILNSAAYRQDSAFDAAKSKIDPENRLLWHRRPLRLEAEVMRDAILFVSGKLNPQMFGPSLKPAVPPEAMSGRNKDDKIKRPNEDGPASWRRSVYLFTKRSLPTPLLETFDAPGSISSCGRRNASTVATQALILLNDAFVRKQAGFLAEKIAVEPGDLSAKVKRVYAIALNRAPSADELSAALAFLAKQPADKALTNFCQVLISLNEFVYVD